MSVSDYYDDVLLAVLDWRESRGTSYDAKRGVVWVVRNRAADPHRWPNTNGQVAHDMIEIIRQKAQFSSFSAGDPNATKLPDPDDPSWKECCQAVDSTDPDPTGGANHYHSLEPGSPYWPDWADEEKLTVVLAPFHFYKL